MFPSHVIVHERLSHVSLELSEKEIEEILLKKKWDFLILQKLASGLFLISDWTPGEMTIFHFLCTRIIAEIFVLTVFLFFPKQYVSERQ